MILLFVITLLQRRVDALPVSTEKPSNDYLMFYNSDQPNIEMAFFSISMLFMIFCYLLLTVMYYMVKLLARRYFANGILLSSGEASSGNIRGDTDDWHNNLDDEEEVRHKVALLSPQEQFYYKQGEEFIKQNPPLTLSSNTVAGNGDSNGSRPSAAEDMVMNEQTRLYIEEEGAHAWEFKPSLNLPEDSVIVENKTELTFLNYNTDVSVTTNLPIPVVNRVYYFECKIFEVNNSSANSSRNHEPSDNELMSFGLSTCPYPYFRLPGRHHHSVAYDSSGGRRLNNSFNLSPELAQAFPKCEKGDVIGVGYRTRSGTVFFTRNGTKLKEKHIGGHIRGWKFRYLYPIIGANFPCKIHVNFGTYGFVFIEANVKKWGYAKANGVKLPPPAYDEYNQDMLLESSYEDEISDAESLTSLTDDIYDNRGLLPPPPGFEFSTSTDTYGDQYTMGSLPMEPPGYSSDGNGLVQGKVNNEAAETDIPGETGEENESQELDELSQEDIHANTFANQFMNACSP
ncbi:HCL100Cp [Eremothecium sinecaudum]|uniref:HCL100Cp n=1 Tax=Eremothecium sinecaudum TaxID=45286 RepID=A0A0X8HQD9_9SACH|nr:HCL100Cp [Eremothecium sinecaudum]AMD20051.1 HCL100Cp [Eremothecium sinecaudum]